MPRPWPYTPTWTIPWGGGVAGRRTGPYIYMHPIYAYRYDEKRIVIDMSTYGLMHILGSGYLVYMYDEKIASNTVY